MNGNGVDAIYGDPDPLGDICSTAERSQEQLFDRQEHRGPPQRQRASRGAGSRAASTCRSPTPTAPPVRPHHDRRPGPPSPNYIPHHQPFQYYPSTANPMHCRRTSLPPSGNRPGEPPVRQLRLLRGGRRGQPTGRPFVKAPALPRRARGLLQPPRRANLPRRGGELPLEQTPGVAAYRHRHPVRRLGRLVRPPDGAGAERLQHRSGHGDLLLGADRRWTASPTAAVTASGCRMRGDLALDTRQQLRQRPPDQHRPRSPGSSRTTGSAGSGSRAAPSTRSRAACTARGGLLDFRTRPNFRPVILDPITGAVVSS